MRVAYSGAGADTGRRRGLRGVRSEYGPVARLRRSSARWRHGFQRLVVQRQQRVVDITADLTLARFDDP